MSVSMFDVRCAGWVWWWGIYHVKMSSPFSTSWQGVYYTTYAHNSPYQTLTNHNLGCVFNVVVGGSPLFSSLTWQRSLARKNSTRSSTLQTESWQWYVQARCSQQTLFKFPICIWNDKPNWLICWVSRSSFSLAMASPPHRLFQPLLLLLLLWSPCSVPRSGVVRTGGLLAAPASAAVKPRNRVLGRPWGEANG